MKFRIARHTTDLHKISSFYQDILELHKLGEFNGHQNYDGVFLGFEGLSWHLEFTVSNELSNHKPDEDDLLVFYVDSKLKYDELLEKITKAGIKPVKPKNPYWEKNGITILDPDGYRIVISLKL